MCKDDDVRAPYPASEEYGKEKVVVRTLPASEDGVFKTILTQAGAETTLREFTSDILDFQFSDITVTKNDVSVENTSDKRVVFDIVCTSKIENKQFNIEMQTYSMLGDNSFNHHINLRARSVFYVSKLHADQPARGNDNYHKFMGTFLICVCNYRVFEWKKYDYNKANYSILEHFLYRTKDGKELSDMTNVIFVDLTQAKKIATRPVEEMTKIEKWVVFFGLTGNPLYREKIELIANSKEGIKVALQNLDNISTNEDERIKFRQRRKEADALAIKNNLVQSLMTDIAAFKFKAATAEAKAATAEAEIAAVKAEVAAFKFKAAAAEAKVAAAEAEIAKFAVVNAENEKLKAEIEDFKTKFVENVETKK
ncbi:MAG: Rpn family recombination-promoting nuclease/putative transposase [Deltaproteobacteria bacterium]|jgi:hypothetical protein|nr:Rpn family recombination-promoting nuclease/putative transposase [Deltaproteobacteria bacterium]